MRHPKSGRSPRVVGLWLLALALCRSGPARAEQPMLAPNALHGGRYVGSALAPAETARLASSLGYGYTESVLGGHDGHQRVAWELYAAWLKWPALQLSIGSELRYDAHSKSGARTDSGFLGATRITTRHALQVSPRLAFAAQPSVLFPGASSPRRGLRAATAELSGLASYALETGTLFGLSLGYRFDRTQYSVPDPYALSEPDRLAASIAGNDACIVGTLVSFPLRTARALMEFSWDIPIGSELRPNDSPMHLRAALQGPQLSGRVTPSVELGVDASTHPPFDQLVRIEPRVWTRVGLNVLLGPQPRPSGPAPSAPPAPPPELGPRSFLLSVLGEWGEPLAGARVMSADGAEEHISDAAGQVLLRLPPGPSQLRIEAEGYAPVQRSVDPSDPDARSVTLSLRLPVGEIKGTVRSLSGEPLRARVEVLPLGVVAQSDALGQFLIEVAPGDYTLRIAAEGYETQERSAQVELRGVTILLIDLRKAGP